MKKDVFENEAFIVNETDVLNYVTKSSTKKHRRKFDIGDVYINAAVCLKCKDYIRSKHRHDFRECKCKATFVDGGSWYQRMGGEDCVSILEKFYD